MSLPEINLLIQSLILIMFLASLVFKMKAKFFIHGALMLATVIAAIASFLWFISVKAPTFTDYMQQFFDSTLNLTILAVHVSLTASAVLLGTWTVIAWRFRTNLFCASKKKLMRIVSVLWILGYIVGVLFFFVINTNLIA